VRTLTFTFSGGASVRAVYTASDRPDTLEITGPLPGDHHDSLARIGPEGLRHALAFFAGEAGQTLEISDEGDCPRVIR